MTIRRSYDRVLGQRQKNCEKDKLLLQHKSKERLRLAIEKKFQTCFIGVINSVEEHFGDLWGKFSNEEKTAFQAKVLKRWKILRREMLDKGNDQLRAMLKETEEYDVVWNGHNIRFDVGDNE